MKYIFSLFSILIVSFSLYAQGEKVSQSYDDMRQKLLLTEIPPLDTLFASARLNNAIMLKSEVDIEIALRQMKTEQHNWWSYIRAFGTYQYGVMASLVDISQGGTPVNPQYSQQAQSWWSLGIGVSIPFNEFIDRSNRIKNQRAQVRSAQYDTDIKFDELKVKIAEAYSACILALTLSRSLSDRYNFAKAQYELSEKDFLAGRIDSADLINAKSAEVDNYVQLQTQLSNLTHYSSLLETLSKVKILSQ